MAIKEYVFDIETMGFNPLEDKVLAIGIGELDNDRSKYYLEWKVGERETILRFFDYLSKIPDTCPIYGYNILRFDVPFLLSRALVLREHGYIIYDDEEFGTRLLSNKCFVDLMQAYTMNVFRFTSFDKVLTYYRLKRKSPERGIDVPLLYKNGKYKKILGHLKDDIRMLKKVVDAQKERGYLPIWVANPLDGKPRWMKKTRI